jgi:regulatory protein
MKGWGKNKIKMHLKQKQIGEKLIHSCWDEIDEKDYQKELKKQYDNYFAKLKGLKDYQKKTKTIQYMMGRGFEYDVLLIVNES